VQSRLEKHALYFEGIDIPKERKTYKKLFSWRRARNLRDNPSKNIVCD